MADRTLVLSIFGNEAAADNAAAALKDSGLTLLRAPQPGAALCHCASRPGSADVRAASRRSTMFAADDVAQILAPTYLMPIKGTIPLPEGADITRASPSAG